MIYTHDNSTETKWNRGQLQVMIKLPTQERPMGYCDGTSSDEQELHDMAEQEGVVVRIQKKALKTGREIWTVGP